MLKPPPSLIVFLLLACAPLLRAQKNGKDSDLDFFAYTGETKVSFPARVNELDSKGIGLLAQGRFPEALKVFDDSLKIMPKNPRALSNRAVAYLKLGDEDKALADYREALAAAPEFKPAVAKPMSRAYLQRGRKRVDAGEPQLALNDFSAALKLDPKNAAALSELSFLAQQAGQYPACVAYAESGIRADPKFSDNYANRGACLFGLGRREEAVKDLDAAIRLDPNHAPFYASRAGIFFNTGRRAQALKDAQRAVALDPSLKEMMAPILNPAP